MNLTIITGGQTGADQAGWRAAKRFGLDTGGWMPLGYLTEDGPRPEFAEMYGAREHTSPRFQDRTPLNVNDADLTIVFGDPESNGAKCAYKAFRAKIGERGMDPYSRSYSRDGWIPIYRYRTTGTLNIAPGRLADVLARLGAGSINVAGNRESSFPGIGQRVEDYLCEVFRALGYEEV